MKGITMIRGFRAKEEKAAHYNQNLLNKKMSVKVLNLDKTDNEK